MKNTLIKRLVILLIFPLLFMVSCQSDYNENKDSDNINDGSDNNGNDTPDNPDDGSNNNPDDGNNDVAILDPTNDDVPSGYYDALNSISLSDTEAFKSSLSTIINTGAKKLSYSEIWTVVENADKSSNEGYLKCFYTGQDLRITSSNRSYNREHVWAKSHGFPNTSDTPYTDAYHLRPTLISINSSRGNSDFGEVDHTTASKDNYGNYWISTIFEPRDEVKGDVARILLYMETRYYSTSPYNLELVKADVTASSDSNGKLGNLDTLLKWNYQDPVSDEEISRSNIIYDYQNNRNPFVDHPEFVDIIYPSGNESLTVDQTKVDAVISAINALNNDSNQTLLNAAKTLYDALNSLEKTKVTNYSKLDDLLNSASNPEGQVTVDFTTDTTVTNSYANNQIMTVDGKTYKLSIGGKFDGFVRLGKKPSITIDAKYGLASGVKGAVLEFSYNLSNLKQISFNINQTYSGTDSWVLLLETSSGYTKLAEGTDFTNIKATGLSNLSGKIAFVIIGDNARVALASCSYLC